MSEREDSFRQALSSKDWTIASQLVTSANHDSIDHLLPISLMAVFLPTTIEEDRHCFEIIKRITDLGPTTTRLQSSFRDVMISTSIVCIFHSSVPVESTLLALQRLSQGDRPFFDEEEEELIVSMNDAVDRMQQMGIMSNIIDSVPLRSFMQFHSLKKFVDLAGQRLNGNDFIRCFKIVCQVLNLVCYAFNLDVHDTPNEVCIPISTTNISLTLHMLADRSLNVDLVQTNFEHAATCYSQTAEIGNTELIDTLLKVANSLQIAFDVNEAVLLATRWGKTDVMVLLKNQGFEIDIGLALDTAARAGSWGSLSFIVQEWEVDDSILGDMISTLTNEQLFDMAKYLVSHLSEPGFEASFILRRVNSEAGVDFLLRCYIAGSEADTYREVISIIAQFEAHDPFYLEFEPHIIQFLRDNWSFQAFYAAVEEEESIDFVHFRWVARESVHFRMIPAHLQFRMQLHTVYGHVYEVCKELVNEGYCLSLSLRGQIWRVASRLGHEDLLNDGHNILEPSNSFLLSLMELDFEQV